MATEQELGETAIDRIRAYVLEAAKTPITRESILDEPKVDAPMPDDLRAKYEMCGKASNGKYVFSLDECKALIERIVRLEAALNARKQTELAQYDEMQGLCRLVLSETGK